MSDCSQNQSLNDFFYYISYKFYKENDLSDITWAMCQTCEDFRNLFLKFFFPKIKIVPDIIIEREKATEGSRPDFYIENGNELYLIENKINDKNHHFGQYDDAFNVSPEKFGYITNYSIIDADIRQKGYKIHTWEELYNYFSKQEISDENSKSMIEGYLEYVKKVCSIIKIEKPMRLTGIYSLFSLIEIIEKKLSQRDENEFSIYPYNTNRNCGGGISNGITGVNFHLKYKAVNIETYGWFGIYYERPRPDINIGFYNSSAWGAKYIEMLNKHEKQWSDNESFNKPYFEGQYLWFDLSKDLYDKFENSNSIEEQEAILKKFMDDVIMYPIKIKEQQI